MERVLGAAIGDAVKALHEAHGVIFHLETTLTAIHPDRVTLSTGADLAADLVVPGIGVLPDLALAEAAGIATDRCVLVAARSAEPHVGKDVVRTCSTRCSPAPHNNTNILLFFH